MILYVPSANTMVVLSGSLTAVAALVVKSMPLRVKVLVPLSQVESAAPKDLYRLSRAIAAAPLSEAVKSAVSVAGSAANVAIGNIDRNMHIAISMVNNFFVFILICSFLRM